jgi:hypothetical protein
LTAALVIKEGVPFPVTPAERRILRVATNGLHESLKLSLPALREKGDIASLHGIAGTIVLSPRRRLTITPKLSTPDNWMDAVVSLIDATNRLQISGERPTRSRYGPLDPIGAVARIYSERLQRAFIKDGPILSIERKVSTGSTLDGRLDVTQWARGSAISPHRFPYTRNALTANCHWNRSLAQAARILAAGSQDLAVRMTLRRLASLLEPEPAPHHKLRADADLPTAWTSYQPAWSIARAILSRTSLLGPEGHEQGLSFCIELWPLLEQLLERSLGRASEVLRDRGRNARVRPKKWESLLISGSVIGARVEPDGALEVDDAVIATFEAKYARRDVDIPVREHVPQALAAARAVNAPIAVLVYPDVYAPNSWTVTHDGPPRKLVTMGLDLFGYRPGCEKDIAHRIIDTLDQALIP